MAPNPEPANRESVHPLLWFALVALVGWIALLTLLVKGEDRGSKPVSGFHRLPTLDLMQAISECGDDGQTSPRRQIGNYSDDKGWGRSIVHRVDHLGGDARGEGLLSEQEFIDALQGEQMGRSDGLKGVLQQMIVRMMPPEPPSMILIDGGKSD